MILKFFGIRKSEKSLAKEAKTNNDIGTSLHELINLARKDGFYCYIQEMSSIHILRHFISQGLPVIINYVEPSTNDGHYAVVIGYKKGEIIMNDPTNGKNFHISNKELYRRWNGRPYNNSKKWIMITSKTKVFERAQKKRPKNNFSDISKKPIISGKQYNPIK